jgi:hypothetical protein
MTMNALGILMRATADGDVSSNALFGRNYQPPASNITTVGSPILVNGFDQF